MQPAALKRGPRVAGGGFNAMRSLTNHNTIQTATAQSSSIFPCSSQGAPRTGTDPSGSGGCARKEPARRTRRRRRAGERSSARADLPPSKARPTETDPFFSIATGPGPSCRPCRSAARGRLSSTRHRNRSRIRQDAQLEKVRLAFVLLLAFPNWKTRRQDRPDVKTD
jgi:hypothetical protein